jgi:hypothetical protein
MKTFLIQFWSRPADKPRGALILDFDIAESDLVTLVERRDGDPSCRHCRGMVVAEHIRDLAYEMRLAPSGLLCAIVHDVSADRRVTPSLKNRLLKQDEFVESIVVGIH